MHVHMPWIQELVFGRRMRMDACAHVCMLHGDEDDVTFTYGGRWVHYYIPYLALCASGLLLSPFCFVVTLLDMVTHSRLLQKVISSVTDNQESLFRTFALVTVVIYHFSLVGQLFFRNDYMWNWQDATTGNWSNVDLCSTTLDCLMNTIYLGLSYGGLAEALSDVRQEWVGEDSDTAKIRWAVDLLFFIAVIVLLLNIIFGIVIDTFASQRDKQALILDNMENVCFICGIDRNSFDRKHPIGFEYHRKHEHNIWHYLSYIIHLRTRKKTDYTGPESYVAEMLDKKDLSFFPLLRTSSITIEDQISNESLLDRVNDLSDQMVANQERIESLLEANLEKVRQAASRASETPAQPSIDGSS